EDDQPILAARHCHVEQPRHGQAVLFFVKRAHRIVPAPPIRFLAAHHGIKYNNTLFAPLKGVNRPHLYIAITMIITCSAQMVYGAPEGYYYANVFHSFIILQDQPFKYFDEHLSMYLINRTKSVILIFLGY